MIITIKKPQPVECKMLREGQVLFTYLHLEANESQTGTLTAPGVICIAYETVADGKGHLPLLKPMSEFAGRATPRLVRAAWKKAS